MEREHRVGVVGVHEGAGAVVDGFARDADVVGVHHAVDEAHAHPLRHQPRLRRDDGVQQAQRTLGLRIVARDHVVGQRPQRLGVAARGEELEGADADVAAAPRGSAPRRAGRASRSTVSPVVTAASARVVGMPSACIASRHDVFAQHGAEPGAPVAHAANRGCGPRP